MYSTFFFLLFQQAVFLSAISTGYRHGWDGFVLEPMVVVTWKTSYTQLWKKLLTARLLRNLKLIRQNSRKCPFIEAMENYVLTTTDMKCNHRYDHPIMWQSRDYNSESRIEIQMWSAPLSFFVEMGFGLENGNRTLRENQQWVNHDQHLSHIPMHTCKLWV